MHELGIMYHVVKTVVNVAKENNIQKVDTLVLQIGELASVVPHFIESCYPVAVDGTILEDTELKIEIIPGNARCRECGTIYNFLENKDKCPACSGDTWEILSGKEFNIKEIVAY